MRGVDTGDYAVPQAHMHHHIITPAKSTSSLMRCGSCPGSTGVSRRGSSSESSPAGTVGNTSIIGGSDGASVCRVGSGYYTDHSTGHYDRMPIPIPVAPVSVARVSNIHSEDEIEPAYATVFPNTTTNIPQPQQQITYQAEDRSIYRRGARRWRKLYRINGHIFQAKRFNRVSLHCRLISLNHSPSLSLLLSISISHFHCNTIQCDKKQKRQRLKLSLSLSAHLPLGQKLNLLFSNQFCKAPCTLLWCVCVAQLFKCLLI